MAQYRKRLISIMVPGNGRRLAREAAARVPALDRAIRALRHTDEIVALNKTVYELRRQLPAGLTIEPSPLGSGEPNSHDGPPIADVLTSVPATATVAKFLTFFPPGHFYSPVPDLKDIDADVDRLFADRKEIPGLDLRDEEQLRVFYNVASLAREVAVWFRTGKSWTVWDTQL